LEFLTVALKYECISVNIITKNRADYIKKILEFQNFSLEQLANIHIDDTGNKAQAVQRLIKNKEAEVFICDDSFSDMALMEKAAIALVDSPRQLHTFLNMPGQFPWNIITNQVNSLALLHAPKERTWVYFNNLFFKPQRYSAILAIGLLVSAFLTGLAEITAMSIILGVTAGAISLFVLKNNISEAPHYMPA
jgi:hypothetical protein